MSALSEAIRINLLAEYKALDRLFKNDSDYQMGRFLIYQAIIDMIKFDNENGDMKEDMTPADDIIWNNIYQKIREGGMLLSKTNEMNSPLVWIFIPDRFRRLIDINFDGIGGWNS